MDRTDKIIARDIIDQLYWDNRVDESDIEVDVAERKVTLTGEAPNSLARSATQEDAWMVSGVISVDNQINVKYPDTFKIPADEEIQSRVEKILDWNQNIDIRDLKISVIKGWVTLEGSVDAYWKKIRAESLSSEVFGVFGITNKLAVVPSESIIDRSVAEDIVSALNRNPDIDVDSIDVEVNKGEVNLSGSVSSRSAARAAYNVALYTTGVIEVYDNLIIETS